MGCATDDCFRPLYAPVRGAPTRRASWICNPVPRDRGMSSALCFAASIPIIRTESILSLTGSRRRRKSI